MLKFVIFYVLGGCLFLTVSALGDALVQVGVWDIMYVNKCEEDESFPYRFGVEKYKMDRTTDCFDANMTFDQEFNNNLKIVVDICKYVDGGCKDYQRLTDESVVNFIKKFAEDNLKVVLEMAGIDPPDFPVAPGSYYVHEYILNKCEFPCKAMIGKFDAKCMMMDKDNIPVGCVIGTVDFREAESEEELCDKCRED